MQSLPPGARRKTRSKEDIVWTVTSRRGAQRWECRGRSPTWSPKLKGLVAWDGAHAHAHTHSYYVAGGCTSSVGWSGRGLGVALSKAGGARGGSHPAERTSPEQGPPWASGCTSSSHCSGVFSNERLFQKQERDEEEASSMGRLERCQTSWYWNYLQSICLFALSLPGYF